MGSETIKMTETEKVHFGNVKQLWFEDGSYENWTLENNDYRCKVRMGIFQWFEFRLKHGWLFVPKEKIERNRLPHTELENIIK